MSFPYWGALHWPQYSRSGHTSAEWRGRITAPTPSSTLPNATQEAGGCLCHKPALLARVQLVVHLGHKVLPHKAAFPSLRRQHVPVHGIVPPQGKDFAFLFVDLCEVPLSPVHQPVQVPLNGSDTNWCIHHSSLMLCHPQASGGCTQSHHLGHRMNKLNTLHCFLGHTTSNWPLDGLCAHDHSPLGSATEPVLNPHPFPLF